MDLRIITADFPVIHINGASIDAKLYAHRTAAELDHPDGSVTWNKLSEDVQTAINDKSPAAHTHNAADIYVADGRDLEQKLIDMGADTSELVVAVSELNDTVDEKIDKTAIGTYCKYNLVAGITSQLCVAAAYPVPGVSKYALVVNDKLIGDITAIGKPLKIASMLTTATNTYLCFMTSKQIPVYYAQLTDNIKNDKFTAGILTYFTPANPWIPDEIDDSGSDDAPIVDVPVSDDVFE
mgnify:CR=1 FL=1